MSAARPRVGVDLHAVDGLFQGSRSHLLGLFPHVFRLCPELDFVVFLDDPARLVEHDAGFALANVRAVRMPATGPLRRLGWQLPRLERAHALDLIHTQYIAPLWGPARRVVTLHDVLFTTHPEYFTPAFRLRSELAMRWSARRAAHVFTVSRFSAGEISARFGVPPEKLTVVENAVDHARFRPGDDGLAEVRALGLEPDGYLLCVGRLEPRKDHLTLLEAYARLGADAPPLALVGQPHFRFEPIYERVAALGLERRVRFYPDVGERALPALYRHARVFVYASRAEGFGLPPLEALASGCPVVTTRSTAITEVVGDAGLLCPPGDVEAFAHALAAVLGDPALRAELRERGFAAAQRFDWGTSAATTARVYRDLLAARHVASAPSLDDVAARLARRG